nr:retrovirus-related Pol polyprotein from transposon TNT 1-94 [Tanacetum cinerariifolium]
MLSICSTSKIVVFKAPKLSSNAERVSQDTKPGAQPRHEKHSTSSKQRFVSSKEATKGASSIAPTGFKTGHLKRKKDSSSTMESNPRQTSAFTPVVTEMHKEDQQASGSLNTLGVTSEERVDPQLSSGMSAFNLNKPIYSASFIIHSESTLGDDALVNSTAEADPRIFAPNQTQSVSEGLETVLNQPITGKGASSIDRQVEDEEASRTIKVEDLVKLVDEDEEADKDEVHTTTNIETKDALVLKTSSHRPPMLDRTDFASWQQRFRLYCRGKENEVNILKSIDEGPFQMGTLRETLTEGTEGALHLGPEQPRVYSDHTSEEKDRYNADIRATNILLQGLPKDIYSLINHYTNAKNIWDNVKMLLKGSKLTKKDRESQLYDNFEHFRQYKGESIQDYYVRFAKLINDMRNIEMTMSRMQLNSKFVNNMLPE